MSARLGYTIFYVDDVEETLSFFTAAFDIARRFVSPEGDYGELETGETTLSFAANSLAATNLDKSGGFTALSAIDPPVGASITLITDDVDAAVERALAEGATRYTSTAKKPWGQTVAYLRDTNGILIEVATPVDTETTSPTIDAVCAQCSKLPGTTVDNTFGEEVNVYRVANKMFALINVGGGDTVTVKVQPDEGEALRAQYTSVTPGYYMNKRHWVTVDVNGDLPSDQLAELITESRRLVITSLTKAQQRELTP